MERDLLDFTKNQFFKKIIHDKGVSFSSGKIILLFMCLILAFSFLIFRCPTFTNNSRIQDSNILFLFIIFLLLSSLYFLKRFATPIIKQSKAKSWKKTIATITEIGIYKIKIANYPLSRIGYFPAIMYEFNANKKKYKSHNISFEADYTYNIELDSWSSNQYDENNKLFSQWIHKQEVEIFYNQSNPNESVVFKDFKTAKKIFYIIMTILSMLTFLVTLINFVCLVYFTT